MIFESEQALEAKRPIATCAQHCMQNKTFLTYPNVSVAQLS